MNEKCRFTIVVPNYSEHDVCVLCSMELLAGPDGELPDRLKNLEPRLLEHVSNEIMDQDPNVRWDDIGKYLLIKELL